MLNGIVNQCLVAVRREPFERSEMINQLLFGERFLVLEKFKSWLRISVSHDEYEGWIDEKLCLMLTDDQVDWAALPEAESVATRLFSAKRISSENPIRLCPGSSLYFYNTEHGTFRLGGDEYKTFSNPVDILSSDKRTSLVELAAGYINSPYLWGGRSPYGIDCSGFIQILFKQIGMSIPRDSSQQVLVGSTVDFINLAQPGDLTFFDDEEGKITHVGMILPEGKIIHASGFVKIDRVDHQGIFSLNTNNYTHKLRVIKNLFNGLT